MHERHNISPLQGDGWGVKTEIGLPPYPKLFRPFRAIKMVKLINYQLSTINYQLNEMYGRRKEESGSRDHPIHHHRIGSFARLICSAGMLLTSQIVWDV